jgi:hypothetical protein
LAETPGDPAVVIVDVSPRVQSKDAATELNVLQTEVATGIASGDATEDVPTRW